MVRTCADIDFKLMSGSYLAYSMQNFVIHHFPSTLIIFIVGVYFFCLLWRCVVKTVFVLALFYVV